MLKNKFGMTKVLVIVLSVLMLVSLVACNKADGPSTDDMNAAIQAAIDAANAEQAAKEAALAASIAADKAAQEAKDAAVAESLAKEKAENDAALKKAQEEAAAAKKAADEAAKKAADEAAAAKKAADEAAKKAAEEVAAAKKAAEQAADAAAKKAAEEAAAKAQEEAAAAIKAAEEAAAKAQSEAAAALKAAEEAAAKAQAEADRVAAELAAELAAAKAAAEKAAEEAAKAQAEASKAKEEAEKAKEEAANVSSKLDETTVVPPVETTVAPETTTAAPETTTAAPETTTAAPETTTAAPETTVAPETTTEAPVIPVDKTDVYVAYSKLKTEYTYTNQSLYNAAEYAELIMLFDKASLDLNNAATVEAANAVLETLKVDAAAVRSVKIAAAEVAALVNALGDIETEVFTTQAEKITEAQKAYTALKKEYASYFGYKADTKQDNQNGKDTVKIANKLGINVADLNKALAKLDVLSEYIETVFVTELKKLYINDTRATFRANDATLEVAIKEYNAAGELVATTEDFGDVIDRAYYLYRVLSVVNYGDLSDAKLAINWEYAIDETTGKTARAEAGDIDPLGKAYAPNDRVYNEDKPTEFFTAEDFIEIYALPTLDLKLDDVKDDAVTKLDQKLSAARTAIRNAITTGEGRIDTNYVVTDYDINYAFVDAGYNFRSEIADISFVEDYKADATLDEAKADIYTMMAKAYINAVNYIIVESKNVAATYYVDTIYANAVNALDVKYAGESYQTETQQAFYAKELAREAANKDAFLANVDATPVCDYDEINALIAADEDATIDGLFDYITADGIADGFYTSINGAVAEVVKKNFQVRVSVSTGGELGDYIFALTSDLALLRNRLDPTSAAPTLPTGVTSLYNSTTRGSAVEYIDGTGYLNDKYYTNAPKFDVMVATVEEAIAAIEAIKVEDYTDVERALKTPTSNAHKDAKDKALYWTNADAKAYFLEKHPELLNDDGSINQAAFEEYLTAYSEKVDPDDSTKMVFDKWTNVNYADKKLSSNAYFTISKTNLPINYVYTAEEQALAAASAIYKETYESIHKTLMGIKDYAKTEYEKITVKDKNATGEEDIGEHYQNILTNVSGNAALTQEVKDFADIYVQYIKDNATMKNSMAGDQFYGTTTLTDNLVAGMKNDHFTYDITNVTTLSNAKGYTLGGVTANIEGFVDDFENAFFAKKTVTEGETSTTVTDYTKSNVVVLYNYRQAAVNALKTLVGKYTYTYGSKTEADGSITAITTKNPELGWVYNNSLISAAGAAYEAEVQAKLDAAIKNIEAVRLNSTAKVVDALNGDLVIKAETDKFSSGYNKDKYQYSIDQAKALINAYMVKLAGYDVIVNAGIVISGETITASNILVTDVYKDTGDSWKATDGEFANNVYGNATSELFIAYKTYYMNNYETIKGATNTATPTLAVNLPSLS